MCGGKSLMDEKQEWHEHQETPEWARRAFGALFERMEYLTQEVRKMAIDQATFDTDLAGLVSAVNALISAVAALPQTDLSAEDQSVQAAAAQVQAELAAITPAPPAPTPAP